MSVLPRAAIRLLELQAVPLSQVGVDNPELSAGDETKKSTRGLLGKVKIGLKSKSKVEPIHSKRKQRYTFNMAAWLRFGLSDENRLVTLCLSYTDAAGEHVALVEEQLVEDKSSSMLSSFVEIETKGPLLALKVACAGLQAEDRCYIEDLSIKRAEVDVTERAAV